MYQLPERVKAFVWDEGDWKQEYSFVLEICPRKMKLAFLDYHQVVDRALSGTIPCSFGSGVCFASRVLAFKGVFVSLTPVSHMDILRPLSQDFSKQHHRHHSLTREAKTQQEHPA